MAWGLWEETSGMAGGLNEADISRMTRSGIRALGSEEGLELFDAALASSETLMFPVSLNLQVMRAQVRTGMLPKIFSDLISVPAQIRDWLEPGRSFAQRLAATPQQERESVVLDIVRDQVATVLGHASPDAVNTQRTFKELGFDSLAAVELRNRLSVTTGLRLPATLIFDHPTTSAVTWYLVGEIAQGQTTVPGEAELDMLEHVLLPLAADHSERVRITSRLQALISKLDQSRHGNGSVTVIEKIDSATDDELFRYLDEKAYVSRAVPNGTLESQMRGIRNER